MVGGAETGADVIVVCPTCEDVFASAAVTTGCTMTVTFGAGGGAAGVSTTTVLVFTGSGGSGGGGSSALHARRATVAIANA